MKFCATNKPREFKLSYSFAGFLRYPTQTTSNPIIIIRLGAELGVGLGVGLGLPIIIIRTSYPIIIIRRG